MELQSRFAELQKNGMGLAVITYDAPAVLKAFAEKHQITFPLLSDQGSATIRAFGLLNEEMPAGTPYFGVPYPGTLVCDRTGKVTARYFEEKYQERVTVGMIAAASGTGMAAVGDKEVRLDLPFATVRAAASDGTIAPGNRFAIVLDIAPKPGLHIYAPGEHTYRAVKLEIREQLGLAVHPLSYPPAKPYRYAPLNETVPVYDAPFRLVQELTLPVSAAARDLAKTAGATLKLEGTLEIQGCTAEKCYPPERVPLSFELALRPLL